MTLVGAAGAGGVGVCGRGALGAVGELVVRGGLWCRREAGNGHDELDASGA